MQKTIVVELEDRMRHPLYGKIIRTTKKVKAHDENSTAGIGDRVSLMETRPTVGDQALAARRDPREGQVKAKPRARAAADPVGSIARWPGGPRFRDSMHSTADSAAPRILS